MRRIALPFLTIVGLLSMEASCHAGREAGSGKDEKGGEAERQTPPAKHGPANMVHISTEAQRTANMETVTINARRVPNTLNVAGQIVPNEDRTSHIGSYVAGRVMDVKANVGDRVRVGQVLARIHSHEVHETLAAYRTAQEEVHRQETALDYSTRMRDRMQRLFKLSFASVQEVERSEADLRTQSTNLANARIALQGEVTHLSDILHMNADELPNINETNDEVPVVSPIAGTVTARMVTPSSAVEPGQELYTVTDLRSVWMMAAVYEQDIASIRVGAKATVTTASYPEQEFRGEVTRLGAALDSKTRTLPVRLVVPNGGEKLRLAMYATAELQQGTYGLAVFVPEEAMQEVNGGAVVFVRRSAEDFEVRPVSDGRRVNGEVQIQSGLKAGEQVVVKSSFVAKSELLKSQIGE